MLSDIPIYRKPNFCLVAFPSHSSDGGFWSEIIVRNDYLGVILL